MPKQTGVTGFGAGGREDHRRDSLVQQYAVDLVHQHEVWRLLHLGVRFHGELVAQIIKAKFAVRAVEDVAGVGCSLLFERHPRLGDPDGEAQQLVDRAHPFAVASRQIGVRGGDPRWSGAGVEHRGKHRRQRLSLASLHLRGIAVGHRKRAQDLLVEGLQLQRPAHRQRCQREHSFTDFPGLLSSQPAGLRKQIIIAER